MNNRCSIIIIAFIITLLLYFKVSSSFAKSFDQGNETHEKDWYECLGISDKKSQAHAKEHLRTISNQIDKVDKFCYRIKRTYFSEGSGFRCDTGYHRNLFHWGFNADPTKARAVEIHAHNLSKEKQQNLFRELRDEQSRRNRKIIEEVEMFTGFPRQQSRALATILYDIHILGDYETTEIGPLIKIHEIKDDIIKHGITDLKFSHEDSEKITQAIRNAALQGEDERKRAKNIMSAIKMKFPSLLLKYYGNTLVKNNIVITPADSQSSIFSLILDKITSLRK